MKTYDYIVMIFGIVLLGVTLLLMNNHAERIEKRTETLAGAVLELKRMIEVPIYTPEKRGVIKL